MKNLKFAKPYAQLGYSNGKRVDVTQARQQFEYEDEGYDEWDF